MVQLSHEVQERVAELRTGDRLRNSVPLGQITPVLSDPSKARYEVEKSQEHLGIRSKGLKHAFTVFHALDELPHKHGSRVDIQVEVDPTCIFIQTAWMKESLQRATEAWITEGLDEQNHQYTAGFQTPRRALGTHHGLVTDGDRSFFLDGDVHTTCCFDVTMNCWVPVLYTWVNKLDTAHHRPHFRRLFRQIVSHAGPRFESKFFLNVMDFSSAQRLAFVEEYVDIMLERMSSTFNELSAQARSVAMAAERATLADEAKQFVRGCDIHFRRSSNRLRKNGALVPPPQADTFDGLLNTMLSSSVDIAQFQDAAHQLHETFPRIRGWLQWWLRPNIAAMIFPSVMSVDPVNREQVPSTTNPIEAQHSLLHHATGTNQDLFEGIDSIIRHVLEMEHRFQSIQDGHTNATEPRKPPKHSQKPWGDDDGRVPDTYERLAKTKADVPQAQVEARRPPVQSEVAPALAVPAPHDLVKTARLQGYPWQSPNSCFFNAGQEIWFQAFYHWPLEAQEEFLASVPTASPLAGMFYHFQRRMKKIQALSPPPTSTLSLSKAMRALTSELSLAQDLLRSYIFDRWSILVEDSNADDL
ncbi:hypothetical protein OF83DRAFT_1288583 [Amylostereum chailletii]|nr:hypothetical protein OF83DRAFT_1288583 [Amylostereum chailletii]